MKINHHQIVQESQVKNHNGKGLKLLKLQWNPELTENAACRGLDTDLFYPDRDIFNREEESIFARMCAECPVIEMCLEWGLVHERSGVWGGTTPYRRQVARRALNLQVADPRGFYL
tara:strand:- start:1360 stop:1707 length:348 start_codon:yes stop_codon:yes gene_type:complete